jgi:hypothetical protein
MGTRILRIGSRPIPRRSRITGTPQVRISSWMVSSSPASPPPSASATTSSCSSSDPTQRDRGAWTTRLDTSTSGSRAATASARSPSHSTSRASASESRASQVSTTCWKRYWVSPSWSAGACRGRCTWRSVSSQPRACASFRGRSTAWTVVPSRRGATMRSYMETSLSAATVYSPKFQSLEPRGPRPVGDCLNLPWGRALSTAPAVAPPGPSRYRPACRRLRSRTT